VPPRLKSHVICTETVHTACLLGLHYCLLATGRDTLLAVDYEKISKIC